MAGSSYRYRSPIEALNHELEHNRSFFESHIKHFSDSKKDGTPFYSLEEKQAIEVENQAARKIYGNKAKIRNHHGGSFRTAKNGLYPLNH